MHWMLIACLSLVLAGCGQDSPTGGSSNQTATSETSRASSAAPDGQPVTGDRIIMGVIGEPSNLIPPLATDSASGEVSDLIYVAPLKYDKDLNIVPEAAERYEVLENGKVIRITLRRDVRWHDGVPLTAADVEFTYRLMIDPKTPTAYAEDYKLIKEFKLLDDYTFEARYDEPFSRALITWAHKILPKHALEREDLTNTKYSRSPLGAGPYKLKEWTSGQRLVLEANDDYFEGRPYIDQVVYRIIPDISTQFLELKARNLDFMGLTPQQYLFQTKGGDWDRSYAKYKYLSFSYVYLGYNLRHPLFQDKRVRQALALAVNKEELVKGVLLGLGEPTIGPYKPGTWVYNDRIRDYPYDPAAAKALLEQAGWTKRDSDGVLLKDGRRFSFTILTNQGNDQRIKAATIIQNRLKDIGVEVKIRTVEWAAFIKEFIDKGNFEATILGWNILQDPDIYDVWHSSKAAPGGLNFVGYKSAEADDLLERGRKTLDRDERKKIYDRLQEVLLDDQPYLFLFDPMALPIIDARFHGIEVAPAGITHNFIRWWVPKGMQRYTMQE